MQEIWVLSLGWEDSLEKEMATHSSTLGWKIPRAEEPCRLQSMESQRVGHDWATSLHFFTSCFSSICWKDYLVSIALYCYLCQKSIAHISLGLYLTLFSPIVLYVFPFIYLLWVFKWGSVTLQNLFFFIKTVLAILGHLILLYKF